MRTYYNPLDECTVYQCPNCSTVYHEYSDYEKQKNNTEFPFIKLEQPLLYEDPDQGHVRRLYHYACPHCGMLQIDLTDL
jgi:predicted RNA-binding Zn-ribbon protein involved in translation (DUF1610 family)